MQRNVVKLVELNKKRGFDIARDLSLGNVLVEINTGRIKLRSLCGDLVTSLPEFEGYRAAGLLFHTILWTLYRGSKSLSEDNFHFQKLLAQSLDEARIVNHACLLGRSGRVGLSLKVSMLMRNDLEKLVKHDILSYGKTFNVRQFRYEIHQFYRSLPYTSEDLDKFPTDSMNDNLKEMRRISEEFKDQDRSFERENLRKAQKDPRWSWKSLTGNWLVAMNRNGTVHPPYGLLQSEAVDLLHSHTALYLPVAQARFMDNNWWKYLQMENYFPEK